MCLLQPGFRRYDGVFLAGEAGLNALESRGPDAVVKSDLPFWGKKEEEREESEMNDEGKSRGRRNREIGGWV